MMDGNMFRGVGEALVGILLIMLVGTCVFGWLISGCVSGCRERYEIRIERKAPATQPDAGKGGGL